MLDKIKKNPTGAVIGGIIGAYTIADFAVKKFKITSPKGVIATAVASTILGVIGGAQIESMLPKKSTTKGLAKQPTAKDISDAKNDPIFNPKG